MPEIALLIPIIALAIPIVAIMTAHQRHMAEMRLRGPGGASGGVAEELRKLQQQITDLRETTTQYDVSFDTALQRLEGRMGAVEQRMTAIEGKEQARIGQV